LVTGPTGSGKTTTLYSFLRYINSSENKIITIEDPIEYRLDGIEQTQIDVKKGYTFEAGLRSILRQDPDVILVGEIRDGETAKIGANAALTGHLVFSTLHTNNSAGAIPRLIDLGVGTSAISSSLSVVIAQRLVRVLCPKCKAEKVITESDRAKIQIFIDTLPIGIKEKTTLTTVYEPKGCEECRNGYKGRIGVFELFRITDEIREYIAKGASEEELKKVMREKGMVNMQTDGILKVLQGKTTFDEVERSTGPIEWLG
jgi:type II secretory ATPase GspE/PulE/Tfp pilus assembly ATPase PilB-like protein